MISDVPGDDPSVVASGPTVADPTTFAQALAILERYRIDAPEAVREHLEAGARDEIEETPKPGDPRLARGAAIVAATAMDALEAAARRARARGVVPVILGGDLEGEARTMAAVQATAARRLVAEAAGPAGTRALTLPCVLLSGGETTVTVRGQGPRRPEHRVPAGPGTGAGRPPGHPRIGGGHGRHRWYGGQRWSIHRPGYPAPCPRRRTGPARICSRTTTVTPSSRPWRPVADGSHPHQRERSPGDTHYQRGRGLPANARTPLIPPPGCSMGCGDTRWRTEGWGPC